jgi:ATP-dependent Lon protease
VNQTQKIPLFPLGLVLLPEMSLPLHIFEERYKRMVAACLAEDGPFGVVLFDGQSMRPTGCAARIERVINRYADGRMDILTRGERRFVIHEIIEQKSYLEARVVFFDDHDELAGEELQDILATARTLLKELSALDQSVEGLAARTHPDPKTLSFAIAAVDGFTPAERQRFLEMTSGTERLRKSVQALSRLVQRQGLTQEIQKIIGGNGHLPQDLMRLLAEVNPDEHE